MATNKSNATGKAIWEQPVYKTTGEVLEIGDVIEPVRDITNGDHLLLLHWDGANATLGPRTELNGRIYQAADMDPTVLRAMTLPTKSESYGSVRQLLDDFSHGLAIYAACDEPFGRIVWRFVLSSWVVEGLSVAPSVRIVGDDTIPASQLFQILAAVCRRPMRLTEVTSAGLFSLPLDWHPTLLIRQRELDPRLRDLLDTARRPHEFIPRGRRLLNLHCAVATFSEIGSSNCHRFAGIEIPAPPVNRRVEILAEDSLRRMTEDFQSKLVSYRFENFAKVRDSKFDAPQFLPPIRDLARSLGACTPGDADLQAELLDFLKQRDLELRSARWTDLTVIVLEALLYFIHERKIGAVYVGEIAKAAEVILRGRGETREVEPREVGRKLRDLQLKTEIRDARGIKLLLAQDVSRRVHELARNFAAPSIEKAMKDCPYCNSSAINEDQTGQGGFSGQRTRN